MMAVAGSAFAAPSKVVANATFPTGAPATTNNDDSCDISTAPAATLLLPYFEVDMDGVSETTLFTITNTSALPQIAHVTIWTDYSFPVLDFNIFLTGYDVQSINLADIIVRGRIAPPNGTSVLTSVSPRGVRSAANTANALLDTTACDRIARTVPAGLLADLQSALVDGETADCDDIGSNQPDGRARGYVTADVSESCSTSLPTDADYYTSEILFDNVLVGDFQQVDDANNFAQGNPMVHIRAIPEGGDVGIVPTNFDRTFYSRYQAGGTADRRQPLPSVFAARWIEGGPGAFNTGFKIWREGVTGADADCDEYILNSRLGYVEIVRFDEQENPETFVPDDVISPLPEGDAAMMETQRLDTTDGEFFPPTDDGDVAGWMYMNLDNGFVETPDVASQNWVVVSMEAEGRYSVDFDAAWLANGCTPAAGTTRATFADTTLPAIGPGANATPDL
jgi:hypothetical protein